MTDKTWPGTLKIYSGPAPEAGEAPTGDLLAMLTIRPDAKPPRERELTEAEARDIGLRDPPPIPVAWARIVVVGVGERSFRWKSGRWFELLRMDTP